MPRAVSPCRYAQIALFAALLAPVGSGHAQSRLVPCPVWNDFNATLGVPVQIPQWWITAGYPQTYVPQFTYGTGGMDEAMQGYNYTSASYNFSNIVSNDSKVVLESPWISATCRELGTVHAPGDTTWTSLITKDGNGGSTRWLVSAHEEECEDEESRAPSNTPPLDGFVANMMVDCDPGGGGTGGGSSVIVYCLYTDYYDENDNFLYSVLEYCWEEEA
jgi:hypothetical protein